MVKYGGYSYLHLGENVDPEKFLIAKFYVESTFPLEKAAEAIASESSVGTWTKLSTMEQEILKDKAARVISIDKQSNIVVIAYPNILWEGASVPQLLSGISGNIFGLKEIVKLKLLDVQFNYDYVRTFNGPDFGIQGIRDYFGVYDRPLLGTIVKPKVGLSSEQHAKVAFEAWYGGVDIVKDDENLTSHPFNNFYRRIHLTLQLKRKAEAETGEKKLYLPNITATPDEMYRRAQFVREQGGQAVMIDILTAGFGAVEYIRKLGLRVIIHGHRAMHAALTRLPHYGVSMMFIAKLARLAGVDELHIGTVVGKMEGGAKEVIAMHNFLKNPWYGLKTTMHVASGGLHPGLVEALINVIGDTEMIINMGGGIHGHPKGTYYGAKAARQAIDLVVHGKHLSEALTSDRYPELKIALEQWGLKDAEGKDIITLNQEPMTYQNVLVR